MNKYEVDVLKREIRVCSEEEKKKFGSETVTKLIGYEYVFETDNEDVLFKYFLTAPNESYRILYNDRVLCFIHQNGIDYFLNNFAYFLEVDKRAFDYKTMYEKDNKAEKEFEKRKKRAEKINMDEIIVDLENLNTYNGVEQVYENNEMDYDDYLILEEEKEIKKGIESKEDEILEKVKVKTKDFYV